MSQLIKYGEIEDLLKTKKEDFINLVGRENFIKELSFAVQAINGNDKLQQCEKTSIGQAVYNVALTGLSLNPLLKFAALTPRFVKGQWQCVLMPQYQGLTKLITDTGSIKNIYAYNVYEGDVFEVSYGTTVEILHKPKFTNKNLHYSYAVAILPDGSKQIEVMNREELEYIRSKSDSYKAFASGKVQSAIWEDFFGEMCRKTVIKRIVKFLPKTDKTEKWEQLGRAIDEDNSDFDATDSQIDLIENLINNSTYDHDTQSMLTNKVRAGITMHEAKTMIRDLEVNQLDRISGGAPGTSFNATSDINNHIRKLQA